MAASGLQSPEATASSVIQLLQSQFLPDQTPLRRRFQTLLEGASERWMYAIYWEYFSASSLFRWADGHYQGNGKTQKATSPAEQAQCESVFRLLSIILDPLSTYDDCDEVVIHVTDPEWFFLFSMAHTFVNGAGLLGQAFFHSSPVWLTGPNRLSESACPRARQLQEFGFQTMVCIPCPNGVVELASTEVVLPNLELVFKVRDLINFNCPVVDPTSGEILRPWEDKRLHEGASIEMQNHEINNLSKQSRGKKKKSDSGCSSFLLSGSSEVGSDSTYSHSNDYSGPS